MANKEILICTIFWGLPVSLNCGAGFLCPWGVSNAHFVNSVKILCKILAQNKWAPYICASITATAIKLNDMKSTIFSAAHKNASSMFRTTRVRNDGWGFGKTYREIFVVYLKKEWAAAKYMAAPVESFTISLQYSEVKLRDRVKALGGKWNADSKVWVVSCKRHELGALESKIFAAKPETKKQGVFNTGLGFYGTASDAARGFDGIE